MSDDRQRTAEQFDRLVITHIVPGYLSARRQLDDWMGDHASSTIGAGPPPATHSDPDEVAVTLTSVESRAQRPDKHTAIIADMEWLLADLVKRGRWTVAEVDGVIAPVPSTPAQCVAMLAWISRRCVTDHRHLAAGSLKYLLGKADKLAIICENNQPPAATKILDACQAHAAANIGEEADAHYRRVHLCRWCGDFRRVHGVNPPPSLVRMHDRGITMSATLLRRAGIRIVA